MPEEKPKGVYSTLATAFAGTGMTRRKTSQKRYWFVWEVEDGRYALVSPLNQNLIPTGHKRSVPYEEFRNNFTPEPDFFIDNSMKVRRLWQTSGEEEDRTFEVLDDEALEERPAKPIARKGELRQHGADELSRSEQLEREIRADFGLAISYLKRGEKGKAIKIFEDLAEMDGDFEEQHKHMFNDFGIDLRKSNLLRVAMKHYRRALDLAPDDENLYHNMARLQYELGDYKKAEFYLNKSLDLNPEHKESRQFLKFIQRKADDEAAS